jgi:hypothetical protein
MMGSGLCSITVNGEAIGLRFAIVATRMFLEKMVEEPEIISGDTINEVGAANLIYCGYVNNCMVKDMVPEKTLGFFLEFVEQAFVDEGVKNQIIEVAKVYSESKYSKKVIEATKDNLDEAKKKLTGTL